MNFQKSKLIVFLCLLALLSFPQWSKAEGEDDLLPEVTALVKLKSTRKQFLGSPSFERFFRGCRRQEGSILGSDRFVMRGNNNGGPTVLLEEVGVDEACKRSIEIPVPEFLNQNFANKVENFFDSEITLGTNRNGSIVRNIRSVQNTVAKRKTNKATFIGRFKGGASQGKPLMKGRFAINFFRAGESGFKLPPIKAPGGFTFNPALDPDGDAPNLANLDQLGKEFNLKGLVRKSIEQRIFALKVPIKIAFTIKNNGSKEFEFILKNKKLGDVKKLIPVGESRTFRIEKPDNYQLDLTRTDDDEDDRIPYDFDISLEDINTAQPIVDLSQLVGAVFEITGEFNGFDGKELIKLNIANPVTLEVTDNKDPKTVELKVFAANKKGNKPNKKKEVLSNTQDNPLVFEIPGGGDFFVELTPIDNPDETYDFSVEIK